MVSLHFSKRMAVHIRPHASIFLKHAKFLSTFASMGEQRVPLPTGPSAHTTSFSPSPSLFPTPKNTQTLSIPSETLHFDSTNSWWEIEDAPFRGLTVSTKESLHALNEATRFLVKEDAPVAVPTETVYGLSANALSATAVKKIYAAKERPGDNPLIVHIAFSAMLKNLVTHIPDNYWPLLKKHWPGPLTVLLPVNPDIVPVEVTCGLPTVAVRFPSHPVMRALILHSDCPLAAPSANRSGRPSPTLASHVFNDLNGRIPLILDCHTPCEVGLESTVVDGIMNPPCVLRPGGVTVEQLRHVAGFENIRVYQKDFTDKSLEEVPTTPGMKYRHYSPTAKVVLFDGGNPEQKVRNMHEWLQQRQDELTDVNVCMLRRGKMSDSRESKGNDDVLVRWMGETDEEVGHQLFAALREMDERKVDVVLVEGVGDRGTGLAVMNRLRKAASSVVYVGN